MMPSICVDLEGSIGGDAGTQGVLDTAALEQLAARIPTATSPADLVLSVQKVPSEAPKVALELPGCVQELLWVFDENAELRKQAQEATSL
ncbi:hypothetical protein BS78_08G065100 [Paspalum vaginatum]|nr:hypothetical protein BS78_08G065100 [Paspalum vaginatum]